MDTNSTMEDAMRIGRLHTLTIYTCVCLCTAEDAMRIGRLHTLTGDWENAMIGFMNSGGYMLSRCVCPLVYICSCWECLD